MFPGDMRESRFDRLARAWLARDSQVYAWFALVCTTFSAATFYGYMLVQTKGVWSAPLDDVFIHFDYARSFARGFPFQWTEGNGYSSGNTSLSYPVVLAVGYWLGFRKLTLVVWAATVAQVGVFFFLHQAGRLVDSIAERLDPAGGREHAWLKYLMPPAVLSMGALDWSLWSGMENAWHAGVWGLSVSALDHQLSSNDGITLRRRALWVGAASSLLVVTRPESAVCAAAFGLFGTWYGWREGFVRSPRHIVSTLVRAGAAPVGMLALQAVANRLLTGEFAANGAVAKLVLYQPYMGTRERIDKYVELLAYVVPRLVEHHFADARGWGYLVPALGVIPLGSRRLRPVAVLLWIQVIGWILLISLNLQVRWQNERYAMPAVAWLLLLAAMGLGLVVGDGVDVWRNRAWRTARWRSLLRPLRLMSGVTIAAVYWHHQAPRMQDQIWFFGRASRNIFDQQLTAGYLLERLNVKRVLVGDAGALLYASDRPGIDLIGLGGFHRYPFARSTLNGLGAAIEQIERIPVDERPDSMALYPSWWGNLPIHFGTFVSSVPVTGNVICGGAEKVIYRADWSPLDREGKPRTVEPREEVADEVDIADITSEKEHAVDLPRPGVGFVQYRVLTEPGRRTHDLFDAGRILPAGATFETTVRAPRSNGRLIVRLAPDGPARLDVRISGTRIGSLSVSPTRGEWVEASLALPNTLPPSFRLEVEAVGTEVVVHHLWIVGQR